MLLQEWQASNHGVLNLPYDRQVRNRVLPSWGSISGHTPRLHCLAQATAGLWLCTLTVAGPPSAGR